jgi:hypothetical protein
MLPDSFVHLLRSLRVLLLSGTPYFTRLKTLFPLQFHLILYNFFQTIVAISFKIKKTARMKGWAHE